MKKRGRPSKKDMAAEEAAKAVAQKAEEKERREEQAVEVSKLLRPALRLTTKFFLAEDAVLDAKEVKEISDAGAALLCKYVNLHGIEKYQEEIAFAWAIGKAITKRVDFGTTPTENKGEAEADDDLGERAISTQPL